MKIMQILTMILALMAFAVCVLLHKYEDHENSIYWGIMAIYNASVVQWWNP